MKGVVNKLKVPSTSTLILHYADSLYDTGLEKQYLEQLDFGEIEELAKQMTDAYKDLHTMVLFRKLYVRNMLKRVYAENNYPQVLSLGAGWDPLSLHIINHYPLQVQRIFEVDLAAMPEKEKIFKDIAPKCNFLHFIEADVADQEKLITTLNQCGYEFAIPTVVIFEGLIHYVSDELFRSILRQFRTADKRNVFIMDFALSDESVPPAALKYHQRCLEILGTHVEKRLNTYTRQEITALVEEIGGEVISAESMRDIELAVHHKNEVFLGDGEGVQEMVAFRL